MKLFKKIAAVTMALMIVLGVVSTVQAAVSPAHLLTSETSACTGDAFGTHKYYSGSNSEESADKVYYTVRYKSGGVWLEDNQLLLALGEKVPVTKTAEFSTKKYWHVKLNPKGAGKTGCEAWAFIWHI